MAKKSNKWIVILAVVVVAAAVVVIKQQDQPTSIERSQPREIFAKLDMDSIEQVRIDGEGTSVTLRKLSTDAWGLAERNDFPIDDEQLRQTVMSVLDIEAIDQLTKNPEKYGTLGVEEQPEKAVVRLLDKSGAELGSLYLGKDRVSPEDEAMPAGFPGGGGSYPQGQFFRVGGDPAVYVSKDVLSITADPTRWLKREVVKVEEGNLQEIAIENPTTETLTLARTGTEPFKLATPIPEGFQAKSYGASSVSRALSELSLQDVMAADDPRAASLEAGPTYRAVQKNGLAYVVKTGKLEANHYVRLSAEYDQARDLSLSDAVTSDTQAAKAMPPAAGEIETFNTRHAPWIYQIQQYTYDNFAKKPGDLIEPIKKEEDANKTSATPASPEGFEMPPGAAQFLTQPGTAP